MSATAIRPQRLTATASALLLGAAAAWVGLVAVARDMGAVPGTMGLGLDAFVGVWALMIAAMMLPSVTPFALLYARTITDRRAVRVSALIAGYLVVWTAAALPAYGVAWLADRAVDGHRGAATALAVAIFAMCGAYQLTPLKDRCLAHCRSPLGFVLKLGAHRGRARDLYAGVYHGAFCLACCWGVMALLVAFGLMNLVAMVVLTAVVLAEKAAPWGPPLGKALGIGALVLAVAVVFEPGVASGLHTVARAGHMGGMAR